MAIVSVRDVVKHFPVSRSLGEIVRGQHPAVHALDGVSLDIGAGDAVAVVGESGCGKTTLGRLMLKLSEPTAGAITFDGTALGGLSGEGLRAFRRQAQLVFQNPFDALNPRFTIYRAVAEPLLNAGIPKSEHTDRVAQAFRRVHLPDLERYLDRYPHQLSGGQLQRVVLARALVLAPRFLVADEPVSTQSALTEVGRTAMVVNLLTEDNLPSYHREIATLFGRDGAWGTWVHRWTAEEARHSMVMRDYLLTTRAVDPTALETARMAHMSGGFSSDNRHSALRSIAYVAFQELATRISHRNAGRECGDPIGERMLARIAADENLHMIFYRNLLAAALELAPDEATRAIADVLTTFRMPGHGMPGFERAAATIALGGVYNLRIHHDDVLRPVLRQLKVLSLGGLGPAGRQAQAEIGEHLEALDAQARKHEERRAVILARRAARNG